MRENFQHLELRVLRESGGAAGACDMPSNAPRARLTKTLVKQLPRWRLSIPQSHVLERSWWAYWTDDTPGRQRFWLACVSLYTRGDQFRQSSINDNKPCRRLPECPMNSHSAIETMQHNNNQLQRKRQAAEHSPFLHERHALVRIPF
jgi:hypothetical protein